MVFFQFSNKKSGFSLPELLVVMAIGLILAAIVVNAFIGYRDNQILNSSTDRIIAFINLARSLSLSSQESAPHGIHFESSNSVLFRGISYSPSDPNNKESFLSDFVEISSILLNGGGSDIVFQELTGKTDQYGSIIIRLKKDNSKTAIITVNHNGIVEF